MTNTVGVLKIGWSARDPDERVQEWSNSTGAPGVARVEYAALVTNPKDVERRVHDKLFAHRERGEWFRCDLPKAVQVILETTKPLYEDDRGKVRAAAQAEAYREERRRVYEQAIERRRREEANLVAELAVHRKKIEGDAAFQQALVEWESKRPDDQASIKNWLTIAFGASLISVLPAALIADSFHADMTSTWGAFILFCLVVFWWVGKIDERRHEERKPRRENY